MRDYCDAQAGFWPNSKFWSKFSRLKFTPEYPPPPHFGKLRIWDDQSLLQNTPPPHPLQKTSDLGWPKFTPEYPPPTSENFRFGMTKVYSGIPPSPPLQKTSDLGWPKFTPEYPPSPPPREFQNTESYYMWRLYPARWLLVLSVWGGPHHMNSNLDVLAWLPETFKGSSATNPMQFQ